MWSPLTFVGERTYNMHHSEFMQHQAPGWDNNVAKIKGIK